MDWTDAETFSRPPPHGTRDCADPGASWGHRPGGRPGQDSELFSGYYASAATMMREEHGPPVPELARRMTVCSCHADPARALVPVLTQMPGHGIPPGGILNDSGYAHRDADAWAIPLRQAGAQLIQDLHPSDRGPRGTHHGAIIANGNLYCPATPRPLLELGPLARDATPAQTAAHDTQTAELWSTPSLVETRFSPDALVWVTVVFHGTAAWRNRGLIIFRSCFIEHLSSCAVQLPRLVAGCARQAGPGRGWASPRRAPPHCAAGSPGWSRVTLQRHRLRRRRRP